MDIKVKEVYVFRSLLFRTEKDMIIYELKSALMPFISSNFGSLSDASQNKIKNAIAENIIELYSIYLKVSDDVEDEVKKIYPNGRDDVIVG